MKRALALAVLLSAVSMSVPAAPLSSAPTIAALVEALENPRLGASVSVSALTIEPTPNVTIRFESGSAAPVTAGDDVIGLFFSGSGTYTYRSVDPIEAVNVRNAAKKYDVKASDENGAVVLTAPFEQFFLRAAGVALPKLAGAAGTDLTAAFASHRETVTKTRYDTSTHLLAKQIFDKHDAPVAIGTFTGKGDPAAYYLDGIEERSEGLYALVKVPSIPNRELLHLYWPVVLSEQPYKRNRRDFVQPLYLLTDLDYKLEADAEENGKLDITETITPMGRAQRAFRFSLHSDDFDSKFRLRRYNVRSVTDAVTGKDLSFVHTKGSFLVGLPADAPANKPVKIRVQLDGNFLFRPAGDARWQLGTEPWFPQPGLNGQYYTIHSVVKVAKPYIAFAPGVTIRQGEEGNFNVIENRVDKPVQFAVVHAGKYTVDTKTYEDGITIRVASYGLPKEDAMKRLSNLAWKMIKFYEPWLGEFPFKEFNIIEINELGWGQAPPGTMFITKEAFNPTMGDDNKLVSGGINHRFAHEIAHQYWGHVVKMGSSEEQWVTEAYAEYSSSLAIKKLFGESGYKKMYGRWKANAKDSAAVSSIGLANRLPANRTDLIYNKGAYLLAKLHEQLGDDKFLTYLRSLQGFFAWKYLTTSDMAKLLSRIDGGKDYTAFFDRYYWGTEMP